jgi:SNF2 family DNA or RNA helicase
VKYKWKKRPYHHQVRAVKKLLANGYGGALLMEPRTGKTKVAIDYMSILHQAGKVNRVIVICPAGVMGVWIDQLLENCPCEYRVTLWDRKGRKTSELPRYGQDILDIVIMNYDAFATAGSYRTDRQGNYVLDEGGNKIRSKSRGGRYEVKRKIKRWQPELMILDESHRIKSPSARKSTAIHSFRDVEYRLILTGTVVTKSKRLFDIYSQWKFLNPTRFVYQTGDNWEPMTFSDFKQTYGRWVKKERYEKWVGNHNEADLHTKIHMDAFSITREECYDLPKQTDQIIHVELEESADVYDRMAEDMVARIETGEITEASIRLVQRLRLQQITSGLFRTSPSPEYPEGRIYIGGSEKLRAMESRLEDLMEADEKVVIGALFKTDINRIEDMCKRMKIPTFVIKGGMKHDERERSRLGFPRVSGGAVFIGQPAAAGEGIDLSCASILQWYSLTPSWVNFRQFSDRIALSDKPTFHEFFIARGSIDELMYETLLEDGDIGKKMITSPERLLRLQEGSIWNS